VDLDWQQQRARFCISTFQSLLSVLSYRTTQISTPYWTLHPVLHTLFTLIFKFTWEYNYRG